MTDNVQPSLEATLAEIKSQVNTLYNEIASEGEPSGVEARLNEPDGLDWYAAAVGPSFLRRLVVGALARNVCRSMRGNILTNFETNAPITTAPTSIEAHRYGDYGSPVPTPEQLNKFLDELRHDIRIKEDITFFSTLNLLSDNAALFNGNGDRHITCLSQLESEYRGDLEARSLSIQFLLMHTDHFYRPLGGAFFWEGCERTRTRDDRRFGRLGRHYGTVLVVSHAIPINTFYVIAGRSEEEVRNAPQVRDVVLCTTRELRIDIRPEDPEYEIGPRIRASEEISFGIDPKFVQRIKLMAAAQ